MLATVLLTSAVLLAACVKLASYLFHLPPLRGVEFLVQLGRSK